MTANQRGSLEKSTGNRLSELISWRLLKKNPSGALIWGIFGATMHHKKRMWNERIEMLENPVMMKLYYSCDEAMPKPACQPLIDVYKRMRVEEERKTEEQKKKIEECLRKVEEQKKK